jgi:hypothetical protein
VSTDEDGGAQEGRIPATGGGENGLIEGLGKKNRHRVGVSCAVVEASSTSQGVCSMPPSSPDPWLGMPMDAGG